MDDKIEPIGTREIWGMFGHMIRLDQSCASENIWWIIIKNIKKVKSWERVNIFVFCGGRGGHPKKMTGEGGAARKKIDKLRRVTRFLYDAFQMPPAPPLPHKKWTVP